jgi:hypothetical protein
MRLLFFNIKNDISISVGDPDPDPQDLHVFGPPGSGFGSISQRYGLRLKIMCLGVNYKKKICKKFVCILKVIEKRVGSRSISQRCHVWIRGSGSAPKCHGSPTLISILVYDDYII